MSVYSKSEIVSILETFIKDNWTTTTIAWENTAFKVPESDPWIRVSIQFLPDVIEGLGRNCVRYNGIIEINTFVRYDRGTGPALDLVDEISELLQNTNINGILTYSPDVVKVGGAVRQMNRTQTDWYQITVSIEFDTSM